MRALLTAGNLGRPGDGFLDVTFLSDGYSNPSLFHSDAQRVETRLLSLEPFKSRSDQIRFHEIESGGSLLKPSGAVNEAAVDSAVGLSGQVSDFAFVLHDGRSAATPISGTDQIMVETTDGTSSDADVTRTVAKEAARVIGGLDPNGKGPLDGSDWKSMVASDEYFAPGANAGNWNQSWKQTSYRSILTNAGSTTFDFVSLSSLKTGLDYWASPSSDTQAPLVAFDALRDGSEVAGVVPVKINATDDRAVTAAQLWVDGKLERTSTEAPFTLFWKTGSESLGNHSLVVKAFDAAGNVGQSSPIQVNLTRAEDVTIVIPPTATGYSDATPPKIVITYWPGEVDGSIATLDGVPIGSPASGVSFTPNLKAVGAPANQGVHTLRVFTTNQQVGVGPNKIFRQAEAELIKIDGDKFDFTSLHETEVAVGIKKFTVSTTPSKTVNFYLDGALVGTGRGTKVDLTLDTRRVPNGLHLLVAKSGLDVSERTIAVNNPRDYRLPTVTITSPKNLSTVRAGLLSIGGKAVDNDGVAKVELLVDGQVVAETSGNSFTFKVNTTPWAKGKHAIRVRATDLSGNVGLSPAFTLTRV